MRLFEKSGVAGKVLACGLLGFCVLGLFGCPGVGGTVSANNVLTGQVQDLLDQLGVDINTVTIRIINQTIYDVQIDLLVDGLPQQLNCTALAGVCDLPLPACPQTVETVEERRLDSSGRYQGGRIFHNNKNFTFTQAEGDFECGSIIVYTITDASVQVNVL
ncbi:MAG: hypothetical protein ACYTF1_15550 [Planctomycetota bacterium]